jgi:hypothetical protein
VHKLLQHDEATGTHDLRDVRTAHKMINMEMKLI